MMDTRWKVSLLLPLLLWIINVASAIQAFATWGQGFPWSIVRPHSVHPFLHWSLFHQLPTHPILARPPSTPPPFHWESNRAQNRLFPSAYGKTDPYNRAEHRLFPSHPSQDLRANRPEHRSIPIDTNSQVELPNRKTSQVEFSTKSNDQEERSETTLDSLNNQTMDKMPANESIEHRHKRYASTSESSLVIFPESSPNLESPDPIDMTPIASAQKQVDLAEDKKLSPGGKFVLDGLSLIAGSILGGPMSYHHRPLLASASGLGSPPPPLHPSYPPFLFPGPSAIYPNFVHPYHPMAISHPHSYYPPPNPYQPMSVDSLLVPLVGMVGLSLMVPDIIKTRREGRPSDIGGLDVFRYLAEDEECLRRLACEAGVTISDQDDSVSIQRALERALSAKRLVPEQQIGQQKSTISKLQCGKHMCASWITDGAQLSSTSTAT